MESESPNPPARRRLPPWLKRRLPAAGHAPRVQQLLSDLKLATVCNGAHCPNRGECYASGTATFLILGETCTRACRFCAIDHRDPGPVRPDEPDALATAVVEMGLSYVVVTSVTRDDLPDGGAGHFAACISAVRRRLPEARVEVLIPDFQGDADALRTVLDAGPDVLNHNVETVPRMYPTVRPQADYARSVEVIARAGRFAAESGNALFAKSGLMVGVDEEDEEVSGVLADLRAAGCDIVTIGQYLAPSDAHLPVARFVPPDRFDAWRDEALAMGFRAAACGPFVRSSYHARDVFDQGR